MTRPFSYRAGQRARYYGHLRLSRFLKPSAAHEAAADSQSLSGRRWRGHCRRGGIGGFTPGRSHCRTARQLESEQCSGQRGSDTGSSMESSVRRTCKRAVHRFQPDVAHIHNTWFALSPSIVPAIASQGVPIVMTLHNYRMTCINAHLLRDGIPCELCIGNSPWQGVRFKCYRDSVQDLSPPPSLTQCDALEELGWCHPIPCPDRVCPRRLRPCRPRPDRISIKPNFVPDPGPRPSPPSQSDVFSSLGESPKKRGPTWPPRPGSEPHPEVFDSS